MIKKFKIFESDRSDLDPYSEEDWEDDSSIWFPGEKVICIKDTINNNPANRLPIKKGEIKVVKDGIYNIYFRDTPIGSGTYPQKDFKPYDEKVIESLDRSDLDPYGEEDDWDDLDIYYRGMKVICIKDTINNDDRQYPIKKGEIKIVRDTFEKRMHFEDTPLFVGTYPQKDFKPYDEPYNEKVIESLDRSDLDPYGEEDDWDGEDIDGYNIGDYITVIDMPNKNNWLNNTDIRTFKLTGYPSNFGVPSTLMWSTDGVNHNDTRGGYGIPSKCFRHATKDEIFNEYGIKESIDENEYDYEEEPDWEDSDMLENIPMKELRYGMKVQCIKDCDIESGSNLHLPIKADEIKIVNGIGFPEWIWFKDTPTGHGSYKKENFIKI